MQETFYQKYYKPMPIMVKGAIGLAVAGVAIYAGFTIYKNIKRNKEIKEANKAGIAAASEVLDLKRRGINPTMDESDFQVLSESLVEAMNDCGTDNDTVLNVFRKMKNDADIRMLVSTFGVRFYRPCTVTSPFSKIVSMFNDKAYGGSLSTWLSYDLTSGEIDKINSILASNHINYSF